jgi:hypothetical protein
MTNPHIQSRRYPGYHRILLSGHIASPKEKKMSKVTFYTWNEFAHHLKSLTKNKNYEIKYLCGEILKYMEEHSMVRKKDTLEVYAREINDESSLNFFLKAHIYGCDYKKSNKINEAKYFAPHFAHHIAKQHPGISRGISYIAFIEHVVVSESWNEFINQVKEIRGKSWIRKNKIYLDAIHKEEKWKWGKIKKKRSFLFLSEPRMAFNPAVNKENLQKGKGFLSKQTFSFDELFKARSERIW